MALCFPSLLSSNSVNHILYYLEEVEILDDVDNDEDVVKELVVVILKAKRSIVTDIIQHKVCCTNSPAVSRQEASKTVLYSKKTKKTYVNSSNRYYGDSKCQILYYLVVVSVETLDDDDTELEVVTLKAKRSIIT